MTVTFTFQAQRVLSFDTNDDDFNRFVSGGPSTLSFTFPGDEGILRYEVIDFDVIAQIDLIGGSDEPDTVSAGGRAVEPLLDSGRFVEEVFFGRVDFGQGETTFLNYQLESRTDGVPQEDYFVFLDGPGFGPVTSQAESNDLLLQAEATAENIPGSDPFGPGQPIDLADIDGVRIDRQGDGGTPTPPGSTPGIGQIAGSPGADALRGGAGDDVFVVNNPNDRVNDAGGLDRIETSVDFSLFATGTEGIETIAATGTRPLRLDGTTGDETLIGNAGDNILLGLGGTDAMTGGAGADNFVLFGRATPGDIGITDFDRSEGDRLAIDDQLLGLGSPRIDIRAITGPEARGLLDSGAVGYDFAAGRLSIDADGDGVFDNFAEFGSGFVLQVDDVVIF